MACSEGVSELSLGRFLTKAFLGNTNLGRAMLGEKTLYQEEAERRQLRQQADDLLAALQARQDALDAKSAERYARGHRAAAEPYVEADELCGIPVIVQYHGSNDPRKVDIFYGGEGVPDGPGHGHITMRRGVIDTWWLPGPTGKRERIV